MLDHFIAKNATAHKVNSYCTFCVEKHTILGPVSQSYFRCSLSCADGAVQDLRDEGTSRVH